MIGSGDYMDSDELSAREKSAVLWAEHVTRNTARARDDVFEKVREHFSEEELIELTMMSAYFNFFNRITDSLKIPLEVQKEVDLIRRSVVLDPGKVKRYIESLVRDWPDEIPGPNRD